MVLAHLRHGILPFVAFAIYHCQNSLSNSVLTRPRVWLHLTSLHATACSLYSDSSQAVSTETTTMASVMEGAVAPYSVESRVIISRLLDLGEQAVGQTVVAGGWVKSGRLQGKDAFAFLELNDGSTAKNLQCMVYKEAHDLSKLIATGTSLLIRGEVKAAPAESKQKIELHVTSPDQILFFGGCDPTTYPVPKTKLTLEFLRTIIHLRTRTSSIACITRIRNCLASATHSFFQDNGFLYVHTPLITSSDCEGAGEMFQVTSLLAQAEKEREAPLPSDDDLAEAMRKLELQEAKVTELTSKDPETLNKKERKAIKQEQKRLDGLQSAVADIEKQRQKFGGMPFNADKSIDYTQDFFKKPAFLTVSGQLEAEIYACAMTSVYTFGPTFRAEDSNTSRHLAEFWMIEPEIAFCEIDSCMSCAEDYIRYCCKKVLEQCRTDLEFLAERYDKTCIDRLEAIVATPFKRITYTEAIETLEQHVAEGKVKFDEDKPVFWGVDMASEHERYLCETVFNGPTIVYNYPKEIKSFYMRLNEDGKTVAAMDILVPGVGELVGGSQREERPDVLTERIQSAGLEPEQYSWYLDLRRYGTVKHAGFGLGFERLVRFATGMENIRDVIPFPRYPGHIL
eukprot:m.49597 g.49597  ORF g.49597 m.49597 type:complete len:624 (+) comp11105_c0_seq3:45-1916(+)